MIELDKIKERCENLKRYYAGHGALVSNDLLADQGALIAEVERLTVREGSLCQANEHWYGIAVLRGQELATRDTELTKANERIKELTELYQARAETVKLLEAQIANHQNAPELEAKITELESQLAELQRHIRNSNLRIAVQDACISLQNEDLLRSRQRIRELEATHQADVELIAALEQKAAGKLVSLVQDAALNSANKRIAELETQLAEANEKTKKLIRRVLDINDEKVEINGELLSANTRITELKEQNTVLEADRNQWQGIAQDFDIIRAEAQLEELTQPEKHRRKDCAWWANDRFCSADDTPHDPTKRFCRTICPHWKARE